MAIPIAAILAAAKLIQGGVQKITDRRKAQRELYRQQQHDYAGALMQAAEHAGGDTMGAHNAQRMGDLLYQSDLAQQAIKNRPINYGALGSVVGGVTAAFGGKGAGSGEGGGVTIGAPKMSESEFPDPGEGYAASSRAQAPIIISGPDRGVRRNPDDEDWFGNYA